MKSEVEKMLSERGFTRFTGGRASLFSPSENTRNLAVLILGQRSFWFLLSRQKEPAGGKSLKSFLISTFKSPYHCIFGIELNITISNIVGLYQDSGGR
jgi:hypothetical protein